MHKIIRDGKSRKFKISCMTSRRRDFCTVSVRLVCVLLLVSCHLIPYSGEQSIEAMRDSSSTREAEAKISDISDDIGQLRHHLLNAKEAGC